MIFISYPRTGVNFITTAIEQQTGIKIPYQHTLDTDEKTILNIVRDPKESITSWIAMQYFLKDPMLFNNTNNQIINNFAIPRYIKMYDFLLNNNAIFINYKDYDKIDILLPKLYDILKLTPIKDAVNSDQVHQKNSSLKDYLITSKNQEKYEVIKQDIENSDLRKCYEKYYIALDKCIIL